jgi:membrane protein implicated in regulation of membrane protease activity
VSDLPPPRQPYRASALFHGGLAVVILIFAAITGGDLTKALIVAAAYFVVATAWSWFRFRQRKARPPSPSERPGRGGADS